MKHTLSLLLCAALLICCLSVCAFAEEETTEAESAQQPTHIVFNAEMTGRNSIVLNTNHMVKGSGTVSKSGEWQGLKIEIDNSEDPHIGMDIAKFAKRFEFEPLSADSTPFIVVKVLADEIAFDDFEIYYCAGSVLSFTEDCKTASDFAYDAGNGELFFVFDLTGDAEGAYNTFRVDITGAEEGALMYMTDMVFFATEDEALEWCGYYDQPTTEATTEAPTTEAETEEITTEAASKAPTTPNTVEDKGCGSVIGASLVTLALIALGAVCIKKKD